MDGSCASASTRRLNASCDNSRLIGDGGLVDCIDGTAAARRPAGANRVFGHRHDSNITAGPGAGLATGTRAFLLRSALGAAPTPLPSNARTQSDPSLAVVDLGSNSFRLEIGRVEGDQIYQLDTWRETLRFGAGTRRQGPPQARGDGGRARLPRPLSRAAFRTAPVGRARRRHERVPRRHERARVPRASPSARSAFRSTSSAATRRHGSRSSASRTSCRRHRCPRLVIDIGGGSTEFIIGRGLEPERLESLTIGCVGMTQRFFRDGTITAAALRRGGNGGARGDRSHRAARSGPSTGSEAYGSSGTAVALADILERNAFSRRRHHADRDSPACASACSRPGTSRSSSSTRSKASARRCSRAGSRS